MDPANEARLAETLEAIGEGLQDLRLRDARFGFEGARSLAKALVRRDYDVTWRSEKVLLRGVTDDEETGRSSKFIKNDGDGTQYDGWLASPLPNVEGFTIATGGMDCHVRFGLTQDPADDESFEHGFWLGLYPDKKAVRRGESGEEEHVLDFELLDTFRVEIDKGTGRVVALINDGAEIAELGSVPPETASLFAKVFLLERDAFVRISKVVAMARVLSLDINGNRIGDEGIGPLAKAIEWPTSRLLALDLGLNRLGDAGVARLAQALGTAVGGRVAALTLSHNEIGDGGACSLAELLQKECSCLARLNLCDNSVADVGAVHLAQALTHEACRLTLLDLSLNSVGDDGAMLLAEALEQPQCKVSTFKLERSCLGHKAKKRLAQTFRDTVRLHED